MITRLIAGLQQGLDEVTAEEIADIFWLTLIQHENAAPLAEEEEEETEPHLAIDLVADPQDIKPPPPPPNMAPEPNSSRPAPEAELDLRPPQKQATATSDRASLPFPVPDAPTLRQPLSLVQALRPLQRRVPSWQDYLLDEVTTSERVAETQVWLPALQPVQEPWLDLALVVDTSPSMLIWRRTVIEFQRLLRQYGFFRDVRVWSLGVNKGKVCLRAGLNPAASRRAPRTPQELLDLNGRRLVLVMSDCVSELWHTGTVNAALQVWAKHGPTALVQVLPEWLWDRTALRQLPTARFYSLEPGVVNQDLRAVRRDRWRRPTSADIKIPILTLEPEAAQIWSQMIAGKGSQGAPGFVFLPDRRSASAPPIDLDPQQQVQRFQIFASPMARRLAGLLAAAPVVSLPVIRLVQEAMLRQSRQVHVAEVLLSGLFKPTLLITPDTEPDTIEYEFRDEAIRQQLREETPATDLVRVLSKLIEQRFDESLEDFIATLRAPQSITSTADQVDRHHFAVVALDVLRRRGGRYLQFVQEIETAIGVDPEDSLPHSEPDGLEEWQTSEFNVAVIVELQTLEVEVATITVEPELDEPERLQSFEFEVATVVVAPKRGKKRPELTIQRQRQQAWQWIEDLGNGVNLEMVSITEGSFVMGAPEAEEESSDRARPQHSVTVAAFLMGKYPVTQAQWRVVAGMPQIDRSLDLDPSYFKGDDRPVEQVSWYDAVEFCARLSHHTGRAYRLPSEAEWEYACRAGTTTPFHFGETIAPALANYNTEDSYRNSPTQASRGETTPVGSFGIANGFGLYDMHGNVWEWCLDHWHENYQGAPTDGSAWVVGGDDSYRLLRGGSWDDGPEGCRSANRNWDDPGSRDWVSGFRVVCSSARTLG